MGVIGGYAIKAIATEYRGIVFRSRLEAMCYDYLSEEWANYQIVYEPEMTRINQLWKPDFGIFKGNDVTALVEVKPQTTMFDSISYIISSMQLEDYPQVICMTSAYQIKFNEYGGFEIIVNNEKRWKQAYNNVYQHG